MRDLDSSAIVELLTELGARLFAKGVDAQFYVVGGAAMLLAYGRETMTRDIDAIFEPKAVVYDEARAMAAERVWLDDDWLDDGVKGFVQGPDPGVPQVVLSAPGVSVQVASPKRLLALKVAAARIGRDIEDIVLLAREVGATSVDEVLDIAYAEYGDLLEVRSRFVVTEALEGILPMHPPESSLRNVQSAKAGRPVSHTWCPKSVLSTGGPCVLRAGHGGYCRGRVR